MPQRTLLQNTKTHKHTNIEMENRAVVVKGERGENGMDGEFGVGRYKLLHWEWISNDVLL